MLASTESEQASCVTWPAVPILPHRRKSVEYDGVPSIVSCVPVSISQNLLVLVDGLISSNRRLSTIGLSYSRRQSIGSWVFPPSAWEGNSCILGSRLHTSRPDMGWYSHRVDVYSGFPCFPPDFSGPHHVHDINDPLTLFL